MNIKMIGAAVIAGVMVAGCGNSPESQEADEVAVSVNGEKLMNSRINDDIEAIIKAQGGNIPSNQLAYARQMLRGRIVQSFISQTVLLAKAKADGFAVTDDEIKAKGDEILKGMEKQPGAPKTLDELFKKSPMGEERTRQEFRDGVLIEKFMKAQIEKGPKKDYRAEAQKVIDGIVSNNNQCAASDKAALEKIKGFKATLDKVPAKDLAKSFADLAKANSDCPSSKKGGDLDVFTRGNMVPEFDKVAFSLPVNKVSDPVKTQFGYHLILVTEKHPAVEAKGDKPASPEKVRASHILVKCAAKQDVPKIADLEDMLSRRDKGEFAQNLIMKLVEEADIEAVEEFKHFLPAKKAAAKKAAKPVEKSEKK